VGCGSDHFEYGPDSDERSESTGEVIAVRAFSQELNGQTGNLVLEILAVSCGP